MISIEDGKLIIDNTIVDINFLFFLKEISRGANGIVFLALDTILNRNVAFKIWLNLKPNDIRDKKVQGVLEAKKQLMAKDIVSKWHDDRMDNPYFIPDKSDIISISNDIIGEIYYAGYYKDYFYTVMEFIDGITLKDFLLNKGKLVDNGEIPFGVKFHIALELNRYHKVFISNNIVHGDLHWKNVMILNYGVQTSPIKRMPYHIYKIKVIDFGTSYFSGENVSVARSFDTLIETIDHCIYPFKLRNIKSNDFPLDKNDFNKVSLWIEQQLFALRAAFYELGQEYVGWPLYRAYGTYEITTKGFGIETKFIKEEINEQVKRGTIIISRDFLGETEEWDTFDGRTAIRGD